MYFIASPSFPGSSIDKESTCNAGDLGSVPGLGRSPGEENSYPLQYSGLENSGYGFAKSQTQLSDFHFHLEPHPHPYVAVNINIQITHIQSKM